MGSSRYLIALGSNVRHPRLGSPSEVLHEAVASLEREGVDVRAVSPIIRSAPMGPSQRRYANGAALLASELEPAAMLALLKRIERAFGRRPGGRRWRARVLDLDIVLWSGGCWSSLELTIPHPQFRERGFVLRPATAIVPGWRDPVSGLTLRQLHARLTRPRPLPR
ncbi:MAG TPA: 2-amino-4-hydroxy-6-hydroxymethyldihydropteridine diphosphokinase [Alteraurantiacibacter sp.]